MACFLLENNSLIKTNSFKRTDEGLFIEGTFYKNGTFISLNESLTPQDERRIKDLIRQQLKFFFWNLYTKTPIVLGNL